MFDIESNWKGGKLAMGKRSFAIWLAKSIISTAGGAMVPGASGAIDAISDMMPKDPPKKKKKND